MTDFSNLAALPRGFLPDKFRDCRECFVPVSGVEVKVGFHARDFELLKGASDYIAER